MIRRDPKSNLFIVECDSCDESTVARGENYFEVAFTAQAAGWRVTNEVHCRGCEEPVASRRRTGR